MSNITKKSHLLSVNQKSIREKNYLSKNRTANTAMVKSFGLIP